MSGSGAAAPNVQESSLYQIRVDGHLDGAWNGWFAGLAVCREAGGETTLIGPVADQAALFGLLRRVRDLGLPLISVNRLRGRDSTQRNCR